MFRRIARKLLGHYGIDIVRESEVASQPVEEAVHDGVVSASFLAEHLQALAHDPLNANLHVRYATSAAKAGLHYLAYAEIKTAEYLGSRSAPALKAEHWKALPPRNVMDHNLYFRLASIAAEIEKRSDGAPTSVLDVGGGDGRLAAFIPDHIYCLAEPSFNAISGLRLPFADRSFDLVVSCHVLEHVPVNERYGFLDQLLSKARRGLILLNPFSVEGTHVTERLKLVIDITDADWAKEHLHCSLPTLDDVRAYAEARALQCQIRPSGSITTTLALVFVDHFARQAGCLADLNKLNRFLNEKFFSIMDSADFPSAYLVYLGLDSSQ